MREPASIELQVNGAPRSVAVEPDKSLLAVLREDLGLTGAKYGCGEGDCGACTVLLDGMAAKSCVRKVSSCKGHAITTVEGLSSGEALHAVQEAFLAEEALQCGYCTPGMIVASAALLARNPSPSEAEIVKHLDGNVCRCGVYRRIVAAVRSAALRLAEAAR